MPDRSAGFQPAVSPISNRLAVRTPCAPESSRVCRLEAMRYSRLEHHVTFRSLPVLFVTDLLHPVHHLPFKCFLNGDMRHGRGRRSPVPVLFAGREPDYIAGM